MKIEAHHRRLIEAMTIGDGAITPISPRLKIRHCVAQKDYLFYKYELLKGVLKTPYYVPNNGYGAYESYTKTSSFLKALRKRAYSNGKKRISNLVNSLDERGLAIWYMDDGSLIRRKRDNKIHSCEVIISTYTSLEEAELLKEYFMDTWQIPFGLKFNKSKYSLRCGTKVGRQFLEIVNPYVIPSMKYKTDISSQN